LILDVRPCATRSGDGACDGGPCRRMTMACSNRTILIGLAALALHGCGDDGTSSTSNGDSSGTAGSGPTTSGPVMTTADPR
jgi:hypothetical protein